MYFVYAIKSLVNKYIYVGLTKNIDKRIRRHNFGKERTTRFYRPFKIIFLITTETRIEARKLELYLKQGCGKEFLKSLI